MLAFRLGEGTTLQVALAQELLPECHASATASSFAVP
jgi:hypothetical protein